jgi:hypothetical protein
MFLCYNDDNCIIIALLPNHFYHNLGITSAINKRKINVLDHINILCLTNMCSGNKMIRI